MGAVRATVIPVEIGKWIERTNEWINGRIDMTYRSGGMRNGKGEEGWEYPRIAMQSSRATDGEDERGVWAMTYGRGQVALAGPSAAELDLDVLRGEFKALKKESSSEQDGKDRKNH